jgi:hypothetical protein
LDFLQTRDQPVADREGGLLTAVGLDRGEDGAAWN